MASFSIGEVEHLTGIKAHILRYWEEVVPSLTPKKDLNGRRTYSTRDVEIILRLKHLIKDKKFTIEGARNQIIAEADMNEDSAKIMQNLNQLRGEILKLYKIVKSHSNTENTDE